ncbi:MAG TPA: putative metal-dependent hydrolase [Ignavibacteriaceae bacterium]|nr:putative metal-dependent hydrolase [Ignavibacteriaceae bacterium]
MIEQTDLNKLKYPIGQFIFNGNITDESRKNFIKEIELLPGKLKKAVAGLNNEQLDTPYRKDGWTVRQVIHHIPDSHINAYVRFKLALTEDQPTIKTYEENEWAKLQDYYQTPIEVSLALTEAIHTRWIILLNSLEENNFKKKLKHPDWGLISLDFIVAQYAWHGKHHTSHITSLKERMGWK